MIYFQNGSAGTALVPEQLREGLYQALEKLGRKKKVLALPPDFSRFHSRAGELTRYAWEYYGKRLTEIMPALGTHSPMSAAEIRAMFGSVPGHLFREHRWRKDVLTLGRVPADYVREVTRGKLEFDWPAQVNRLLIQGGYDLILSVGQVVPHEVMGMANYNKNIFVGTGGSEGINKSHYLSAVYGMEKIMGRPDNPVRKVLNYASRHFAQDLPVVYVLTVVAREKDGSLAVKGLFIGDDAECFIQASRLSLQVNMTLVDKPLKKVLVYLDPREFKSTWLGNKSIYRTRMALADGGELIVLAPGVNKFGEDPVIDSLIRKYGYQRSEQVPRLVQANRDLKDNLGTAAHLIHGSSQGRFSITYCAGGLSAQEIKGAGFQYSDPEQVTEAYKPQSLEEGPNRLASGEEIFYISNPALGLWAHKKRF